MLLNDNHHVNPVTGKKLNFFGILLFQIPTKAELIWVGKATNKICNRNQEEKPSKGSGDQILESLLSQRICWSRT